jgi:Fe-S cluster assembly scaffold protein SufB
MKQLKLTKLPYFKIELRLKTKIDFSKINYYKKVTDKVADNWNQVACDVKDTFEKVGLLEAEKTYLAGTHAQYESEVIYSKMIEEIKFSFLFERELPFLKLL